MSRYLWRSTSGELGRAHPDYRSIRIFDGLPFWIEIAIKGRSRFDYPWFHFTGAGQWACIEVKVEQQSPGLLPQNKRSKESIPPSPPPPYLGPNSQKSPSNWLVNTFDVLLAASAGADAQRQKNAQIFLRPMLKLQVFTLIFGVFWLI